MTYSFVSQTALKLQVSAIQTLPNAETFWNWRNKVNIENGGGGELIF